MKKYYRAKDFLIAAAVSTYYGDVKRAARHLVRAAAESDFPEAVDQMSDEQSEGQTEELDLDEEPAVSKIDTKAAIAALIKRGYKVVAMDDDSKDEDENEKCDEEKSKVPVAAVISALKKRGFKVVKAGDEDLDLGSDEDDDELGDLDEGEGEEEENFETSEVDLKDGDELVIDMPPKPTGPKVPEAAKLEYALRAERAARNKRRVK